jgi:hypothetical protein
MTSSMDKAKVSQRICDEADTVPDLLAWTKNQPTSRLPATYNRSGNVWERLMAFRNEHLDKLPDVVTKESIGYLLNSADRKDWMFYTIVCWILEQNNAYGMHEPQNRTTLFRMFRNIQSEKARE